MQSILLFFSFFTILGATYLALTRDFRKVLYFALGCATLAHPYVSGAVVTIAILVLVRERVAHLFDVNGIVLLLWLITGGAALGSVIMDNPTTRGLFVWLKFVWIGLILLMLCQLQRDDRRLNGELPLAAFVGSGLAAWILIALALVSKGQVDALIGPNESSFVLVLLGVPTGLLEWSRFSRSIAGVLVWFGLMIAIPVSCALNESRSMLALSVATPILHLLLASARYRVIASTLGGTLATVLYVKREQITATVTQLLTLDNLSNLERLVMLQSSWQLFRQHPLLGHGWGNGESLFLHSPVTLNAHPHPHNTVAHIAVELGSVGLLFLFCLFAYLLLCIWRANRQRKYEVARFGFEVAFIIAGASMVDALLYGASRSLPLVVAISLVVAGEARSDSMVSSIP